MVRVEQPFPAEFALAHAKIHSDAVPVQPVGDGDGRSAAAEWIEDDSARRAQRAYEPLSQSFGEWGFVFVGQWVSHLPAADVGADQVAGVRFDGDVVGL
jgi:hypothetical protein